MFISVFLDIWLVVLVSVLFFHVFQCLLCYGCVCVCVSGGGMWWRAQEHLMGRQVFDKFDENVQYVKLCWSSWHKQFAPLTVIDTWYMRSNAHHFPWLAVYGKCFLLLRSTPFTIIEHLLSTFLPAALYSLCFFIHIRAHIETQTSFPYGGKSKLEFSQSAHKNNRMQFQMFICFFCRCRMIGISAINCNELLVVKSKHSLRKWKLNT